MGYKDSFPPQSFAINIQSLHRLLTHTRSIISPNQLIVKTIDEVTMSTNLAAILPEAKGQLSYETRPIPQPGAGQILVRNHAIAANPVDWKIQDYNFFVQKYPVILGSDVGGTVEAVGPNVTKFKKGDRVFGFALCLADNNLDEGAFQNFSLIREQAAAPIPQSMSFEEATTFPMGVSTVASGLFHMHGLQLPAADGSSKPYQGQGLVVWGGVSAVGVMAVQIAKQVGFTVFATASQHQHEYVKSMGAAAVVDYKDPDVVNKIVEAAKKEGVPITVGYDAISTGDTPFQTAEIIDKSNGGKGGKLVVTLEPSKDKSFPSNIEVKSALAFGLYTQEEKMARFIFHEWLPTAMEKGTMKPAPKVEVVPGGIKATQKLWDQQKAGVSGKKLVIQVA